MTQKSKDLLKAILLSIFIFLIDLVFGYSIFVMATSGIEILLMILMVGISLLILVPWNLIIWLGLKQTIEKYKKPKEQ